MEEIRMTVRQIKNGKAAGPDNMPAEALKSDIGVRSCTDQIATLQIIVEQSVEWNSSLYINFIDYEKAFDIVDRRTLWKIFRQLKNIWKSRQLSSNIKVRIFNTNVKTVILYGAETWRTSTTIIKKAQVFINSCLHKILNIHLSHQEGISIYK
ncbi:unnamed protein product [Schistosoma margrebowiei]|uniref:Uncharacterized protein n=1 Tax=Schistosoma margrebowiei TaxID=48269 RepID=A0A183M004_9TREM|nr:unnamed protein product [Schistosoma margrebowiei]